uniref:hypothetical protein n=1 Tax=Streptomyces chartreusis TaxID=1969 RepID=UPI003F496BE9
MKDVVAVALITAVTTLAAGGITGGFTYGAARRQVKSHEDQARETRAEERVVRHREVRRDIYVRFLDDMVDAHRLMNRLWSAQPPPSWDSEGAELIERMDSVGKTYTVLSLEGPPDVAAAAKQLFDLVAEEGFALKAYQRIAARDSEALLDVYSVQYTDFTDRRDELEQVFVETARKVLGGDLDQPD